MKILIENSGYYPDNVGDLAMLQLGVMRLEKLFPQASIYVLTLDPAKIRESMPNVIPFSPRGRDTWSWPLIHKLYFSSNPTLSHRWRRLEDYLLRQNSGLRDSLLKAKLRRFPDQLSEMEQFLSLMQEVDLVVATGGGVITDDFMAITAPKLETLAYAARLGKPTAFFGQGLGPLKNPTNYDRAKAVLSTVDLIALREKRVGLPLLMQMGISPDKVMVTGDDAIELAYSARQPDLGSSIGINLRMASYSSMTEDTLSRFRSVMHQFTAEKGVDLLPVPIEHSARSQSVRSDSSSIQELLRGYDDTSDGGASLDTPLKVIQQVGRCRVVVTGSYHAGVFALSQGIPVIGLAKSTYYIDKFVGLADQFPGGCEVILLTDQDFQNDLQNKLQAFWNTGETLRPQLLAAAQAQIELSTAAYQHVHDFCAVSSQRVAVAA